MESLELEDASASRHQPLESYSPAVQEIVGKRDCSHMLAQLNSLVLPFHSLQLRLACRLVFVVSNSFSQPHGH